MEVPSSEIAKNCSDTSPAALKKLGVDFNCLRLTTWPAASNSTRESVVGVRKSVTVSHRSSLSRESTAPTPIDPVAGKSGKARRVKPSRPGVRISNALTTSTSVGRIRWWRVHEYPTRDEDGVGS